MILGDGIAFDVPAGTGDAGITGAAVGELTGGDDVGSGCSTAAPQLSQNFTPSWRTAPQIVQNFCPIPITYHGD